ncbi:g373 [Coccomyxa elongata]
MPLETGGCGRYRSTAPRATAGAQPVLQGQAAGACYRRPALLATRDTAGAAASGAPHRELPPARCLCYRGSRRRLL